MIALRADIAGGDDSALYLGWLLDVQCGEIDDDVVEPALPEGLGSLSPALVSLVDIFGIDSDLVAAAAPRGERVSMQWSHCVERPKHNEIQRSLQHQRGLSIFT